MRYAIKLNVILLWYILLILSSCKKEVKGCKDRQATNYDDKADVNDMCMCRYDGINQQCGILNPASLTISSVRQETAVWCWLAVGEMIFRYYQLPNLNPTGDYQCGIVGTIGYSQNGACDACNVNCGNCIRPAGSPQMISYMISAYPKVACKSLYQSNTTLHSQFVSNFLAAGFLVNELTAKRPVIAGINPGSQFVLPGNSMHVALIVGYYYLVSNLILIVNDPFPYAATGFDPYVFNGAITTGNLSYQIPYVNFVNGIKWNTSWYGIGW
jgi:hypothetical protein